MKLRFRIPAEWEPHARCSTAWAVDKEWGRAANKVKRELSEVIQTIARYEPVQVFAPCGDEFREALREFSFCSNIEVIEAPVDDIWMRDIAPTFALRGRDIVAIDWNFNGWGATRPARLGNKLAAEAAAIFGGVRVSAPFIAEGGAFVTDGKGTIITSRSCLLNKNRNPNITASQIERGLVGLGVCRVIWLEGNPEEPITSGHVDGYVMFGETGEVLVEDISGIDRVADSMRLRDIETLRSSIDAERKPLNVRIVRPPRSKFWTSRSELFAPAYLNAYVANGAVIAGRFGDPERDESARLALRHAFPGREVRMIDINHIAAGGGGVRCLTQPVPL